MSSVSTVAGPIDTNRLGTALMHEHIFILTPEIAQNYGAGWWNEDERIEDAVHKLEQLKQRGVDTLVDLTVLGLGRFIPRIQRVSDRIDINIIVATGLYIYSELPSFFQARGPGTLLGGPDILADLFIKDIAEGIGETGVRAAVLKGVVEEQGLTPDQERVQLAICRAHSETGAPITVHTNSTHQTGHLALSFYKAHGVDISKVIVGHAGDSNDLDYLRSLMDQGATIGCDRFGMDMINPTSKRVRTVAELCRQGYADRIVLSHDAGCFIDNLSDEYSREELAVASPDWNFGHIHGTVLPALLEHGVTEAQITAMMVDNPRRYFT
ncbi:phosphotriesterase [Paenarthrobacter nicotinovorans]|uniref:phosphotriesterase family protein n=1 Tax=Paenarthrobacter nicotinovorans TaxID=29320 RepID=UPI003801E5C4